LGGGGYREMLGGVDMREVIIDIKTIKTIKKQKESGD